MKTTKTRLLLAIGMIASLLISYVLGMRSGIQQDGAFHLLRGIKAHFSTTDAPRYELARFNAFDQLIWYPDKTEILHPPLSPRRIVAFAFGQSNSANHGGEKIISQDPRILNYWDGKFYQASDPLLGASGTSGSVWVEVGRQLMAHQLTDQFIIVSAGITRTSVHEWAEGGRLHPMLLQRLNDLKTRGIEVTHFYWHQGESDYATPPDQYRDTVKKIIATTKRYFPDSKFFVAQASLCKAMPSSANLLRAQAELALEPGAHPGPNTDTITRTDRYDDCHFSGRGLNQAAQAWVTAIMSAEKQKAQPQ